MLVDNPRLLGLIIKCYNDLMQKRNRVENAWAQIDVQLQKDLIYLKLKVMLEKI